MKRFTLIALIAAIAVTLFVPLTATEASGDSQTYNPVVTEAQLNRDWAQSRFPNVNDITVDVQSEAVVINANVSLRNVDRTVDSTITIAPFISEDLTVNWTVLDIHVDEWAANEEQLETINEVLVNSYIRYLRTQTIAIEVTDITLVGSVGLHDGDAIHYTVEDTGERRWRNWRNADGSFSIFPPDLSLIPLRNRR